MGRLRTIPAGARSRVRSRRSRLGSIAIGMAAIAGCSSASGNPARPPGPVVVAYGHSYISGVPGQPPPWPTLLASTLGLPLVDLGHGGAIGSRCLSRMEGTSVRATDSDVVVWECDLNDVRRYGLDPGHLESFRQAFVSVVARLRHGRIVVVEDPPITAWGLYPPFNHGSVAAMDRYDSVIEGAAPASVHVVKVLGWDPATMLARDGVHPNDAGKRAIASTVAAAVRDAN